MTSKVFKCNVCGSTSAEHLLTIYKPDRFEKAEGVNETGYKRKWVKCENCGMAVNHMSKVSEKAINNVASSYYEIDLGGKSELQKKFDYVMNLSEEESDNLGRVNRIIDFLNKHFDDPNGIDICDVGSGLGVFPSKLIEVSDSYGIENLNIIGIEPDPISYSFLQSLDRFPVVDGFFPDAVNGKKFDLITLNKVLEHISDPVDMLDSIYKKVKDDGGLAYIEVPCITNTSYKPPQDGSLGALHYNLYSINTLSSLIDNTGFQTVLAERITEPSGKISVYAIAAKI
ncbi:class I SAM-dependent methyltransferase [Rhodohalobacter sulfatireducens]|uniref:Class I SAM-dependent methyltransferase n=1 Tax=Rhodohalobacter sulfatireducens TaxID=2911366 RepID=A0ABS9KJ26_9BACT|nr:class I SAM-dependent methyltransferase [Rhodohalobacter sulfatireducens]MCG2590826.1 class I SAM-dependent methyltransferase [Rhodohalobacter sulfatireducens]